MTDTSNGYRRWSFQIPERFRQDGRGRQQHAGSGPGNGLGKNGRHQFTKAQMMGWFALCGAEADELPRERYLRRAGGYYFLYGQSAFDQVLGTHLAGVAEWEARLAARGRPVRRRKRVHPGTCTRMPLVDHGLGGS